MRKLRVAVLMHEDLLPPDTMEGYTDREILEWKTEFDVLHTLRDMGHDAQPVGVRDDLSTMRKAILDWKPHVVFNLLEEFHGVPVYDHHVVSYLELMRQPYTGCNPRGLMLAHDKVVSKQILSYHRIRTPKFTVFPLRKAVKRPQRLDFPLLVKSALDDASLGIAQASIVHNDERLLERVRFIHEQCRSDAIVEQYIEGRELYVGVIGNQRLQTFPVWEMLFTKMPEHVSHIATAKVKWDPDYQKKYGIETRAAKDLPDGVEEAIAKLCKRVYRVLSLSGFARMDLRLSPDGRPFVLEANPNPNLAYGEDFAESAETIGISYEALLQRILNLGLRYRAAWRG
jgi:D-alanine-D-alanine ligase